MMRVDPQDRDDMRFLLGQADFSPTKMLDTLANAMVPEIPEIQDAVAINQVWLLLQFNP